MIAGTKPFESYLIIAKSGSATSIGVAVNYRAVHLTKYYRERFGFRRGMFPNAERIGDSTITLPLWPAMTDEQVDEVIAAVRSAVAA